METTQTHTRATTSHCLCGVIVYEDANAYVRALNMYLHLVVHLRREVPFHFSWWSFDQLLDAPTAEQARQSVAKADLVVFSAKPAANWPRSFKAWLESWALPQRKRLGAIGALLTSAAGAKTGERGRLTYLKKVATRLHVDFLSAKNTPLWRSAKDDSTKRPTTGSPRNLVAAPDPAAASPYYGING